MGLRVCLDVFADRNQSGRKLCVHSHTGGPNGGPGGAWGGLALTCVENRLTLAPKNGTPTYVGGLLYYKTPLHEGATFLLISDGFILPYLPLPLFTNLLFSYFLHL